MGKPPFRVTAATLDVLEVLLSGDDELYGLKIARAVDRPAGSIVPILMRLERCGWVTSAWEDARSERRGPRRRFYSLRPDYFAAAQTLVATRRRAPHPESPSRPGLAGA